MKFKRILSFSPRLTFNIGQDGNFYPPLRRPTGMSRRVRVDHSYIEIGEQVQLYSLAEQACTNLMEFGANSDAEINQIICISIEHAAAVKDSALKLLKRNGVIEGHQGLTRERLLKMWPDDLIRLGVKDAQFGIPKEHLSLCLIGVGLHLIDASLCALQSKPSAAVESAVRAAYCFIADLSLTGSNILGDTHPSVKGGLAKRERSERVANYACSLVEGNTYSSRADAVRRIKERVIDYAQKTENWTMSALQADKTISAWLAARGLPVN
ncbi:hypothetical protein [Burkholderia dolosa]|uniref:hypothetical protein n=1 Tax=Burkholderia dolosa TaxID=152500 RepID=UPI0027D20017|nr:hypothetical protein [Burkholderia dolosa]